MNKYNDLSNEYINSDLSLTKENIRPFIVRYIGEGVASDTVDKIIDENLQGSLNIKHFYQRIYEKKSKGHYKEYFNNLHMGEKLFYGKESTVQSFVELRITLDDEIEAAIIKNIMEKYLLQNPTSTQFELKIEGRELVYIYNRFSANYMIDKDAIAMLNVKGDRISKNHSIHTEDEKISVKINDANDNVNSRIFLAKFFEEYPSKVLVSTMGNNQKVFYCLNNFTDTFNKEADDALKEAEAIFNVGNKAVKNLQTRGTDGPSLLEKAIKKEETKIEIVSDPEPVLSITNFNLGALSIIERRKAIAQAELEAQFEKTKRDADKLSIEFIRRITENDKALGRPLNFDEAKEKLKNATGNNTLLLDTVVDIVSSKVADAHRLEDESAKQIKTIETLNRDIEIKNEEIRTIRSEYTELSKKSDELLKTIDTVVFENTNLATKISDILSENQTLENIITENKATMDTYEKTLSEVNIKFDEYETVLSEVSNELENATKENKTLTASNNTLTNEVAKLNEKIRMLETNNQSLSSENKDLSTKLIAANNEYNQAANQTASLESKVSILENDLNSLKTDHKELSIENKELSKKAIGYDFLASEKETFKQMNEANNTRIAELTAKLNEYEKKYKEILKIGKEIQEGMQKENNELKEKLSNYEASSSVVAEKISKITRKSNKK